ncbi:MAG: bifunctional phosphoglucose/phosphomannose isomerase [Candidatus Moraniibacteriota bacterium]|nr:MAG: bifunctional phosphoglucose/phosphomannose isomerase [Candidatus Moranbacteria bacterium]
MSHPIDVSDLRQVIMETPDQFADGFELAQHIRLEGKYDTVMFSGMGGSALPADLLRTYLTDVAARFPDMTPIHILQNRTYGLPARTGKNVLHFACSYSGNTEETLETLQALIASGAATIGVSSGGKVEEVCREHGIQHIKLPIPNPKFQPRMGTGYFVAAFLQVFMTLGMIPDVRDEVLAAAARYSNRKEKMEAEGKRLAALLQGTTPVVYSTDAYRSAAMVWKIKLNENAKTPAFYNVFPELNHNEMVGWTLPQGKFTALFLRDPADHPRNLKRFEITAGLLREKGIAVETIDLEGESVFEKMFSSVMLGDFTSYYLALEYGQDPTPVDMVEKLKKLLVA